jgi:light-independent protochlorophyllide reductase subunit L
VGLKTMAHLPNLDVIRRSPEESDAVRDGPVHRRWNSRSSNTCSWLRPVGRTEPQSVNPMRDRDLFDFLGFD